MYPAEPNKVVRMHVFCHQGQEIFRKEKRDKIKKEEEAFFKKKTKKQTNSVMSRDLGVLSL